MNKTLQQLKRGFESASYKTPEFTSFCRTFKSEFGKLLKELGCSDLECSNGHFEISGFFNSADGRLWYFNIGDVRWMLGDTMLVRTAEHRKDYKGGWNQNANLHYLKQDLTRLIA